MRKYIAFLATAVSLILIIFGGLHYLYKLNIKYPILTLDKGWSVTYRNEHFINTNLEHLNQEVGSTFSIGDNITVHLEKPLHYLSVPFPYLSFKTQFCAYKVFLDDKLIADNYTDYNDGKNFVGMGFTFIPLPENFDGKQLTIQLVVTENNSRADIYSPRIGNYDDLVRYFFHSAIFPLFTSIFLIIFGLVFLVISLLFYLKTSGVAIQVISSILCTVIGIWMLTTFGIADFNFTSQATTIINFSSVYMIVPIMYILIYHLHPRYNNLVLNFLGYSSTAFCALFIVLHYLNVAHINQFIHAYFIICFVGLCMLIYYDVIDIISKSTSSSTKILMLGITVLAFCFTTYIIYEILQLIVDYRQNRLLNFLVPFGSVFFVVTQILNHFIFMTRSFAQRKEYASLSQIAYIDNLTGIPNRASFDKKLEKLDEGKDDFCILSLDLNGLKEVNDNSGHPAGDQLLRSFAACLKSTINDLGEAYRVGGDEFIVLFNKIEKSELDNLLKNLDSSLKLLDEKEPEANHSVSYGYAFRSETIEKDTHTVYMLADQRMYEYKRQYYNHMMSR